MSEYTLGLTCPNYNCFRSWEEVVNESMGEQYMTCCPSCDGEIRVTWELQAHLRFIVPVDGSPSLVAPLAPAGME